MDFDFWEVDGCIQCAASDTVTADRDKVMTTIREQMEHGASHGPARILLGSDRERLIERMSVGAYRKMMADARSALLSPHECGLVVVTDSARQSDPVMDRAAFDRAVYDAMTRLRTREGR